MDFEKEKYENYYFWCTGAIGNYLAKNYLKDNHEILLFVKIAKI